MSSVKKATVTALCTALCAVLPFVFHMTNLGSAFSPMHIPILLCGLVCGPVYGLFCAVAGPVISSLTTGMPSAIQLVYFIPEMAVYGVLTGVLFRVIRTGRLLPDLYLALVPAMLVGRIAGGAAQALFYLASSREYSLAMWAGAYLVGSLPGIILHLIAVPLLYTVLEKAKLIPVRYGRNNHEPEN